MLRCREGVQSEEVAKLNTGKDAGYRLLMHPSGRALVCGMSIGGLQRVDLQPAAEPDAVPKLSLSQGACPRAGAGAPASVQAVILCCAGSKGLQQRCPGTGKARLLPSPPGACCRRVC